MPIVTRLRSMMFSGGQALAVPPAGVVVLVGPNNAGKSVALKEIFNHLHGGAFGPNPPKVVPAVEVEKTGTEDELREWLEANTHGMTIRSTGERQYGRPGVRIGWNQSVVEWNGYPQAFGPTLVTLLVLQAHTEQRLGLVGGSAHWNPFEEGPSAPLQNLFADPELERRLSDISVEASWGSLHLLRLPGGPIDLYLGEPQNEPSAVAVDDAYVEEVRLMPLVREQGDGMRSFIGIMLAVVAAPYPVLLIDEPEAFLHPPQARLLGRKIASESQETQVIVATHSTDFLFGLLAGGAENVTVVRLTRQGGVNPVSILPPADIEQLWSDPLLASSNLLDGLFHRGVVLCEGDTNARYYSAIMETEHGDGAHELFLTHCGGKQRLAMVTRALRALDVPVVVVADLDLLREQNRLLPVVEALGGEWGPLERDWNVLNAAVSRMSAAPAIADVRPIVEGAFGQAAEAGPRLTPAASAAIRAATKVDEGGRC